MFCWDARKRRGKKIGQELLLILVWFPNCESSHQLYQKLVLGCWCQFYFVLFLFYYFWFLGSHTFSSLSYFVDEPNQETSNAVVSHIHMNICVHFQLCWICFSCRNYSVFHGCQFCISRCYKNSPFLCQETDWIAFSLIYYPR